MGIAQVIIFYSKSSCIHTISQGRLANTLKSLGAWDLWSWLLCYICMKLMACFKHLHMMGLLHLSGIAISLFRAQSRCLPSTASMQWMHAPQVLRHCTCIVCPCVNTFVQGASQNGLRAPHTVFMVLLVLWCITLSVLLCKGKRWEDQDYDTEQAEEPCPTQG